MYINVVGVLLGAEPSYAFSKKLKGVAPVCDHCVDAGKGGRGRHARVLELTGIGVVTVGAMRRLRRGIAR
jgi:hypothetical protein